MAIDRSRIEEENQTAPVLARVRPGARRSTWWVARASTGEAVIAEVARFSAAAPSWAVGTGGTRFGRFPGGGEPRDTYEKIDDIAALNALTGANRTVSLHVPWDDPGSGAGAAALRHHAEERGIGFDAMNSNTFQDNPSTTHDGSRVLQVRQPGQRRRGVRGARPIEHNHYVIDLGVELGSRAVTVWLADGMNHPGQASFRGQFERVLDGLRRDLRPPARGLGDVHRAQAVRAGVLLVGQQRLGHVAAAGAGHRRAGQVPRRPRPPPAQHQHRAGGVAARHGGPARRLPLQRLEVRRRRPHRRVDHAVPALPHHRRAARGRRRADARRPPT